MSSWEYLRKVMPGGVSSPIRSGYMIDVVPPVMSRGKGALIYDTCGTSYIDMCMSWGALLHGHAHDEIVQAAMQSLREGSTFGATSVSEGELAYAIQTAIPSMELVRFVSSGTEATMSAVRLARAATGKKDIIKCVGNYHGHADQFLVQAGSGVQKLRRASSEGIPDAFVQHTICVAYNDANAIEEALRSFPVAAVIVEPVCANMGVVLPREGYLQQIRSLCDRYGSLLIFDEVVTGFRLGISGAQGTYGIRPDITCLGKIMGGGFPAAAFGGKKEIMDLLAPLGSVYQAGTLSGNPVAMRAGLVAIQLARRPFFYEELEQKAKSLCDPIVELLKKKDINACLQRKGSMWTLFFEARNVVCADDVPKRHDEYRRFFLWMLANGVYLPPAQNEACFLSAVHTQEQIDTVRDLVWVYIQDF
jgi:glutamate-1-semialdehyde 2,1-aminomutase